MAVAKKKCRHCGEYEFQEKGVKHPAGFFCSQDHAILFAQGKASKARAKLIAKSKQVQVKKVKVQKTKDRARLQELKPLSKWLDDLQVIFNKIVRILDINDGCISCDKTSDWHGQWHASHYYSRGHSSALRFNRWNVHKSCSVCNAHLSGNIGRYTPRLIVKIGQDKFNWLERHKSDIATYDVEWAKRAIKVAKLYLKRLEKRRL